MRYKEIRQSIKHLIKTARFLTKKSANYRFGLEDTMPAVVRKLLPAPLVVPRTMRAFALSLTIVIQIKPQRIPEGIDIHGQERMTDTSV